MPRPTVARRLRGGIEKLWYEPGRGLLGLDASASQAETLVALGSLKGIRGDRDSLLAMRADLDRRAVDELVRPYVDADVIDPKTNPKDYEHCVALARENPERFTHFMEVRKATCMPP